jgi:calcium permeable stress-gated cation channel
MSWGSFGEEPLRDTANKLASSIQDLLQFYVNYIILQSIGLFPLRLLEFGSVSLYPFGLISAKTPRGKWSINEIYF